MLVLFFDTYIVADNKDRGGSRNTLHRLKALSEIRDNLYTYRWQKKIDVVKYTLASYSKIGWDKVIIRFECEDQSQVPGFREFCHEMFPGAEIHNERSETAAQYYAALSAIGLSDNAWIFFTPNNDHPYLAEPHYLRRYVSIADDFSRGYPKSTISILYSHFTESMNDNRISAPQWGYYGNNFKKIIVEDQEIVATTSNKACIDSVSIFQLSYLKKVFSTTKNAGRVIRLEDTEFYLSNQHDVITIAPKKELCRHYDGYSHIMDFVPPLFIPDGFFENRIKIRYGYDDGIRGYVNVNPLKDLLSPSIDLMSVLDDIPAFWKGRISDVDVNPFFPKALDKNAITYYRNLANPWRDRSIIFNYARSILLVLLSTFRESLLFALKHTGLYEFVRATKHRISGLFSAS